MLVLVQQDTLYDHMNGVVTLHDPKYSQQVEDGHTSLCLSRSNPSCCDHHMNNREVDISFLCRHTVHLEGAPKQQQQQVVVGVHSHTFSFPHISAQLEAMTTAVGTSLAPVRHTSAHQAYN